MLSHGFSCISPGIMARDPVSVPRDDTETLYQSRGMIQGRGHDTGTETPYQSRGMIQGRGHDTGTDTAKPM
jgi:hypothetical protein